MKPKKLSVVNNAWKDIPSPVKGERMVKFTNEAGMRLNREVKKDDKS